MPLLDDGSKSVWPAFGLEQHVAVGVTAEEDLLANDYADRVGHRERDNVLEVGGWIRLDLEEGYVHLFLFWDVSLADHAKSAYAGTGWCNE